jgi:hypothetical protein
MENTLHLPPLRHLAAATLLACAALSAQAQISTGSMTEPRMFHQASTLADGRIMITGGTSRPGNPIYASTEIFDPATGQFAPAAPMLTARRHHAAVTLQDGRILVAGGMTPASTRTNSAEIYDPATGQWSATGNTNGTYSTLLARLLPDGRVLISGTGNYPTATYAEVFDPASGTFSTTGNYVESSFRHALVVLADGRVMKLGGEAETATGPAYPYSTKAEIWDPATNQWRATGPMTTARETIQPVLLQDGKVLVAGGRSSMFLNSTEVYDPANGTFTAGPNLPVDFQPFSATVLANGDIVYTADYRREMLYYRAATGTWNLTGPQRSLARDAAVSRLPDGNVLIAGGAAANDATTYSAIWEQACAGQATAIQASSQTVGGDGGTVSFTVTAAPGCHFEFANLPSWLTYDGANPQQMPATGSATLSFNATANQSGASRSASFLLGNQTVSVSQGQSPNCPSAPTVSPAVTSIGRSGGSGTLSVAAGPACPWSVASMPSFATASGTTSGTGNGSISYTVAANPSGTARSGSGQVVAMGLNTAFSFTQDGTPCPSAPTVYLNKTSFTAAGGTATGTVTAAPTCNWTVSPPAWAPVTAGSTGTGNGSFTINVAANSGAARSAYALLTGPGVTSGFFLEQQASPCATWTISPASANIPAAGGTGSFTVSAPIGCTWSLGALPSWFSLTSPGSGSGYGSISYTVAANTGAARSATATLSGAGPTLSVNLNQGTTQAPACTTPVVSGTPISGFLKSTGCPTGARGAGYYTDRYTFTGTGGKLATITLSSSSFDTYLYLRDPAGNVIMSNDDGGGGTNSRISFTLPSTGTYTIEATSYGSNATGAYSLSFTQ